MRLLASETLLLAAIGGGLGLLFADYAVTLLAAYTPSALTFLNANDIAVESRVLSFSLALTLATAVGFGLLPALRTSRTVPHESLKAGVRSATGSPRHERVRRAFVVAQIALALVLLVGAGLLTRTFAHIVRVDPGFDTENLVTASLALPRWKYQAVAERRQFYDQVLDRLRALPGIRAATVAGGAPPTGGGISFGLEFEIEGRGVVLDDPQLEMPFAQVQPEHFAVMGIPIKAGRTFIGEDAGNPPRSIVIGEAMARRLWKGANPLGERLRMEPTGPWYSVVGVAGDVYQFESEKPHGQFAVYYPLGTSVTGQMTLIVRTAADPSGMIPAIKRQIWSVDPDQPIYSIATLDDRYAEFFETPRFYAFLMSTFALMGLVIAAVGLYGTLAYAMTQRTRELGIRIALGAERRDVLGMVLGTAVSLTIAGLLVGAAGSVLITRTLESLLIEIPRTDPITYAVVVVLLSIVALAAAWVPARRATSVDPVAALRQE